MGWLQRLRQSCDPGRSEAELDEELRFHLEMEIRRYRERGYPEDEARQIAWRSFGGFEKTKEEVRDVTRLRWLEQLWQDLVFSLRQFRKRPGFTLLCLMTLALGIGANSAIFSVIDGVLLAPLPFRDGDRLVYLLQSAPASGIDELPFSIPELQDYREGTSTLQDIVEFHSMSFILLGKQVPERVATGVVSYDFFDLLGVKPILGRTFRAQDEDPGAGAVLVLSFEYWRDGFAADPEVVGRVFEMNDRPHRVVGVLPRIPQTPARVQVYMPSTACPFRAAANRTAGEERSAFRSLRALARMKPGSTLEDVNRDLSKIASGFEKEYPETYGSRDLQVKAISLHDELTRQARPTLYMLLATTALVLLIACANVANLLLANWFRRERETAVRVAMGAGKARLVSQALVESLLLTIAGGVLGLLLAAAGMNLLKAFVARFTPRASEISIDPGVMIFTLGLSLISAMLFSLLPVLAVRLDRIVPNLKTGRQVPEGPQSRLRGLLIMGQVAVSCVLLISAGLTLRSLMKLQGIDLGFRTENVLSASISMNWSRYRSAQEAGSFFEKVLELLEREPGVLEAAVGNIVPLAQQGPANASFEIETLPLERGEIRPLVDIRFVSEEFFSTIGIPLRQGRLFKRSDDTESPLVAAISESFARAYWPHESPLGQRVRYSQGPWRDIVGVVGDARLHQLISDSPEAIYIPVRQEGMSSSFLVRTVSDPSVMQKRIRELVFQVDPKQPITSVETLDELRRESIASPRLTTLLLGAFALLALIITLSGISGVIAFSVSRRRHEIGIRMALGARHTSVLVLVLKQGLQCVLLGLATGLLAASLAGHAVSGLLYQVKPTDPMTFLAVSGLFLLVALITCLLPARRATLIDPLQALRSD